MAKRLDGSRCHLVRRWASAQMERRPSSHRKGHSGLLIFRPMSIVAKRLDGSSCHLVRMTSSHITVVTLRILLVPISVHASTHHTRWAITRPVRSIVHVFKTPQLTRDFWSTSTMLWFRHVKESIKTKPSSVSLCCKAVLPC